MSISLVLLGHLSGTKGFGRVDLKIGDYAHLGVVVFFVISGFLITTLLLKEYEKSGDVSLWNFYQNRAFRIFPPAYAYLLCILFFRTLSHREALYAATYAANYLPERPWLMGHLWSLSVEEQFYLLWPFAFAALGPKRGKWAAGAMLVISPLARIAAWWFLRGTPYRDLEIFPVVADGLAAGCLLAMCREWLERQDWYLFLFWRPCSFMILIGILVLNRYLGYTIDAVFGQSLINIGLAILTHRSVYRSSGTVGQALNWKPVAFVGTLSYSLYLWQQPFLNRSGHLWINRWPDNLILAIGAALCSYYLIERPALAFRNRLGNQSISQPAIVAG